MKTPSWQEYLYFSRRERVALLVLFAVIAFLLVLPRFFSPDVPPPEQEALAFPVSGSTVTSTAPSVTTTTNALPVQLFRFDPNTIDKEGLLQLGFRERTARTLLHYRAKGGRFYIAADLRKIYGLSPAEAERFMPYVMIKAAPVRLTVADSAEQPAIGNGKHWRVTFINAATAEDWKYFPGIGEVLSRRIVAFRHKLGGFQSVMQVKQTYGLPDSVFERMLPYLRLDTLKLPARQPPSE